MNVVLSKFYLSTAGSSRVVKDNLLPADHSRSHQAYSLERLCSFLQKKRDFLEVLSVRAVLLCLCYCRSGGDRLRLSEHLI